MRRLVAYATHRVVRHALQQAGPRPGVAGRAVCGVELRGSGFPGEVECRRCLRILEAGGGR